MTPARVPGRLIEPWWRQMNRTSVSLAYSQSVSARTMYIHINYLRCNERTRYSLPSGSRPIYIYNCASRHDALNRFRYRAASGSWLSSFLCRSKESVICTWVRTNIGDSCVHHSGILTCDHKGITFFLNQNFMRAKQRKLTKVNRLSSWLFLLDLLRYCKKNYNSG